MIKNKNKKRVIKVVKIRNKKMAMKTGHGDSKTNNKKMKLKKYKKR